MNFNHLHHHHFHYCYQAMWWFCVFDLKNIFNPVWVISRDFFWFFLLLRHLIKWFRNSSFSHFKHKKNVYSMSNLKLAIQKSGRLKDDSLKILRDAGIYVSNGNDQLKVTANKLGRIDMTLVIGIPLFCKWRLRAWKVFGFNTSCRVVPSA